jgi:hypothetical protein
MADFVRHVANLFCRWRSEKRDRGAAQIAEQVEARHVELMVCHQARMTGHRSCCSERRNRTGAEQPCRILVEINGGVPMGLQN